MRRFVSIILLIAIIYLPTAPATSAYTLQFTNSSANVQLKWPTNTITIALSTSLSAPQPHIKEGSDMMGAVHRALAHWAEAANIQFKIVTSNNQTINPSGAGNGESLITVSPDSRTDFTSTREIPGRARIFFNPETGAITEVDIAINPFQKFSTDGEPGTYDLETTFAHELGHLLGLEHSAVAGATMQPRQGKNGTYNLPAQTGQTLSDDDRAGAYAIYGTPAGLGAIAGTISRNPSGAFFGVHVWAEDVITGRVRASSVTLADGSYRIAGLPPGQYRLLVESLDEPALAMEIASRNGAYQGLQNIQPELGTFMLSNEVNVLPDTTTQFSAALSPHTPSLNPRFIGIKGQLSTITAPLVPGQTTNVLVGGGNDMHRVNADGISITSNFITVNQASVQKLTFVDGQGQLIRVLTFEVTPSIATPPGEYSVRLQSTTGEVAYVVGGLTVDLPNGTTGMTGNMIDDAQFFVTQQYRDILNREPEATGLGFWVKQITDCGHDTVCRESKRASASAALLLSSDFQQTGHLVYRLYSAAFKRFPRFGEFLSDMQRMQQNVMVGQVNGETQLEANQQALAQDLASQARFIAAYPLTLSPEKYVDLLNANTGSALSPAERDAFVAGLKNDTESRATVLRKVAEDQDFQKREFKRALVLMSYFAFLRRNPKDLPDSNFEGYKFWLDKLNQSSSDDIITEMVKAFITAPEYRRRFGSS